jgi:hypothetical protein
MNVLLEKFESALTDRSRRLSTCGEGAAKDTLLTNSDDDEEEFEFEELDMEMLV